VCIEEDFSSGVVFGVEVKELKKIFLIGASTISPTDSVIHLGIKNIFNYIFDNDCVFFETRSHDWLELQDRDDAFFPGEKFDISVIAGSPWLWDRMSQSFKFRNAIRAFNVHPESKKILFGIGSCFFLDQFYNKHLLMLPDDVQGIKALCKNALVITRDGLAEKKLERIGVSGHTLPCPSYLCDIDFNKTYDKTIENVLIWYDPRIGISRRFWKDK